MKGDKGSYRCPGCGIEYQDKNSLKKHLRENSCCKEFTLCKYMEKHFQIDWLDQWLAGEKSCQTM